MSHCPAAPLRARTLALLIGIGATAASPTVLAHHSFAMYDSTRQVTIDGVIKEVQWTNPHVWIQVLVKNAAGAEEEWGIECTSVNFMTRRGFHKHTLKPGDKVSVTLSPLKDGSHGGAFKSINSLNGAPLVLEPQD